MINNNETIAKISSYFVQIFEFKTTESLLTVNTQKKLLLNQHLHQNFELQFIIVIIDFLWKCREFAAMNISFANCKVIEFIRKYIDYDNLESIKQFYKIYFVININYLGLFSINAIKITCKKFLLKNENKKLNLLQIASRIKILLIKYICYALLSLFIEKKKQFILLFLFL